MTVRVEGPDGGPVDVTSMRARELGKHGVVVGDRVRIVGDTSGRTDSLARIVTIEERTTSLRRTADDTDPTERIVVANADLLVIVTAVTDPEPRSASSTAAWSPPTQAASSRCSASRRPTWPARSRCWTATPGSVSTRSRSRGRRRSTS